MKYAVVEQGGKQYRAVEGKTIDIDLLSEEPGKNIMLDSVLLIVDGEVVDVGMPTIKGARVKTQIVSHGKGPKIIVFKYRAKQRYRVKSGHRQKFTRLLVESIERK